MIYTTLPPKFLDVAYGLMPDVFCMYSFVAWERAGSYKNDDGKPMNTELLPRSQSSHCFGSSGMLLKGRG